MMFARRVALVRWLAGGEDGERTGCHVGVLKLVW